MKIKYLGTGAAEGIPALFWRCAICNEARKRGGRELRTRSQAIIDDILIGMKKTDGEYISIIDRHEAISYAMHHAQPGDIVVLAGKGHETYQEIEGKKYHMSEEEIVQDVLDGKY